MSEFTFQKSVRDAIQAQVDAGGGAVAAQPLVERTVRFTVADSAVDETVTLFTAATGEKILGLMVKVLAKPTTWGDYDNGIGGLDIGDVAQVRGYGYVYQYILPAVGGLVVPIAPAYTTFPVYAGGEAVRAHYLAGPQNVLQQITAGGTGGTYALTFDGQTTAPIAFDANAAAIQAALEALSNIGVGDVVVTVDPGTASARLVEFTGAYATVAVPLLVADTSLLSDGAVQIILTQPAYNVVPTGPALDLLIKFLIWQPTWA